MKVNPIVKATSNESEEPDVIPIQPNSNGSIDVDADDEEQDLEDIGFPLLNVKRQAPPPSLSALSNMFAGKEVEFTCNYYGKRLYKKGEKVNVSSREYFNLVKMKVIK